jgi:hypothetical protein
MFNRAQRQNTSVARLFLKCAAKSLAVARKIRNIFARDVLSEVFNRDASYQTVTNIPEVRLLRRIVWAQLKTAWDTRLQQCVAKWCPP